MKTTNDTPWSLLALALIAVFGYHVFVTDARDFLADEPLWYLYIALIALGGGGAFIIIGRTSAATRNRLRFFTRIFSLLCSTAVLVWLIFIHAPLIAIILFLGYMVIILWRIAKGRWPVE